MEGLPAHLQWKILGLLSSTSNAPPAGTEDDSSQSHDAGNNVHSLKHPWLRMLARDQAVVIDECIDASLAQQLLTECSRLDLAPAKMGSGVTHRLDAEQRGDVTRMMTRADLQSTDGALSRFHSHLESICGAFNDEIVLKSNALCARGLQVARYAPGRRYVKHRDVSPLIPDRRLTMILYLNADWMVGDGGHLRLFHADGRVQEVEPRMNCLVIFPSHLEHEVLETQKTRMAVTCWLYAPRPIDALLPNPVKTTPHDSERIFVSIPSFCDPETALTVGDMLDKAAFPDRLRIGVLLQDDEAMQHDWQHCLRHAALIQSNDCAKRCAAVQGKAKLHVMRMNAQDARGPSFARYLIQRHLLSQSVGDDDDDKFYLQIDAHMRFIKNWDRVLIGQLTSLPACNACKSMQSDAKCTHNILTTYPPGYAYTAPNEPPICPAVPPTTMHADKFDSDGMLRLRAHPVPSDNAALDQMFMAAGFAFTYAAAMPLNDPFLTFIHFGEEASMSARCWTAGMNLYAPSQTIVWHLWDRQAVGPNGARRVVNLIACNDAERQGAQDRVRRLLRGESVPACDSLNYFVTDDWTIQFEQCSDATRIVVRDENLFRLGSARTLQQYCAQSGIDFHAQCLSTK